MAKATQKSSKKAAKKAVPTKAGPKKVATKPPAPKKAAPKPAAKKAAPRAGKKATSKVLAKAATPKPPAEERLQEEQYAKGMDEFQRGRFSQALKALEASEQGPDTALRHRARVYIQVCRQKLESSKEQFKTADENYDYAVGLINERRLDEVPAYLDKALRLSKGAAHVHYAMAVLAALRKDVDAVRNSLSAAIGLDSRYRLQARSDSDLAAVVKDERIAAVLRGDDSGE